MCPTNVHINYDFILSKNLNSPNLYTSIELTCGTLIIKIKISICACSMISRVLIYASNEPSRGTFIINLEKTQFVHATTANK